MSEELSVGKQFPALLKNAVTHPPASVSCMVVTFSQMVNLSMLRYHRSSTKALWKEIVKLCVNGGLERCTHTYTFLTLPFLLTS